jgi:ribosomal protein L11 methyltransferase
MDYIEVIFGLEPNEDFVQDVLSAELATVGFESFVASEIGLLAYCPINLFEEQKLQSLIEGFPLDVKISYQAKQIESQNWNEEWEKNYFEPIVISDECVVRSSFHQSVPKVKYDILIDPRMSFGTGHHETTSLMISMMLKMNLKGKSFLDMGCGTAVLAILAAMKGANPVLGIDIDEWAYENSLDNVKLNGFEQIKIQQGGAELLSGLHFDVVFANINRNILLNDMAAYVACLSVGGELYMSGFYKEDIPVIEKKANELGLKLVSFESKNNWVAVQCLKA